MKALQLHATDNLRLHDEPVPIPREREELVSVNVVGISGSDVYWFSEAGIGDAQLERPLVLGHEFAGVTKNGERVAVDPTIPCGECEFCQHGHPNLCEQNIFAGHGARDGAVREWLTWPKKYLLPIPASLDAADGAMLELLGVAIHAVNLGKLQAGMTVGVFGCGPIGLLTVQLARLSGASNIISTGLLPHRVEAAKRLGVQPIFLVKGRLETSQMRAATGGRGVDVTFEMVGEQDTVDNAFAAVVPSGKVILTGISSDDHTTFTSSIARRKRLKIKLVRRMKLTYPRAIELVSKGLVVVRSIVTHRFPLAEACEAFRVAERREGLKIIIEV